MFLGTGFLERQSGRSVDTLPLLVGVFVLEPADPVVVVRARLGLEGVAVLSGSWGSTTGVAAAIPLPSSAVDVIVVVVVVVVVAGGGAGGGGCSFDGEVDPAAALAVGGV